MEATLYRDICFYGPDNQEIRGNYFIVKKKCEEILDTVINNNEKCRRIYEEKYKDRYTYFSAAMDYCMRVLDFKVALPAGVLDKELAPGEEASNRALFAVNNMLYVDSIDRIIDGSAREYALMHPEAGIPQLTDETVGYDASLSNINSYDDGIVTEKGYVSSRFVKYNMEDLASIMLLDALSEDMELYNQYRETYQEGRMAFEFYTALPNIIGIDNLDNGTFALSFVSENNGRVQDFINALENNGLLADLDPQVVEPFPAPMVIESEPIFKI